MTRDLRSAGGRARHLRRRSTAAAVLGVLLAGVLAGCERTTSLGAYNACGFAVEVDANGVSQPSSFEWAGLDDGQRRELWQAGEVTTEFFVWVRTGEGAPVTEFSVMKDELAGPPQGYDYDLEIVLDGDRCPTAPPT